MHFKSLLSSTENDNDIQVVIRLQEPRIVSCSTYLSSDTDSTDAIQNAQPCKYSEMKNDTTDDGNDEQSPETQPSPISNEDESTPVPPEGMSQPQVNDCPMTSTLKESVNGVYSLVANQPTLSTL